MLRSILVLCALQAVLGGNEVNCIQNTGGSCKVSSCSAWRGNTKCDAMRCFCDGGTCAGTDQVCHAQTHKDVPYKRVESKGDNIYEIQNARWPNYFLYVQVAGTIRASTDHDGDTSDYFINKPPHDAGDPNSSPTAKSYIVLSRKWPTSALYGQMTNNDNQKTVAPVCAGVEGSMGGMMPDPSILNLALTFTKAPKDQQLPEMLAKNQTLVMLSSPMYSNYYFYLSKTSWQASAWEGDPGAGGYWYIKTQTSVPLPMTVQNDMFTYSGPRCSSFCGKAQAHAHSTHSLSLATLVAVWAAVVMPATGALA